MSVEKEYELDFFKNNGFVRKVCPSCEMAFWTQDEGRKLCGDPPCVEYAFIGKPVTNRGYTLPEMREKFLGFFEKLDHARIKRYPVVARWRDDIYLTIASIADFQPHVTSGDVPPPANPLTISQPCIRLNDLDTVGKTGRHLTTFEMMAHHVFNSPDEYIYFKERTTELCHEFMTKELGMDGREITYKENPWAGGGNAGPAIEVLVRGLEVATLVFMQWVEDPNGEFEVKGDRYTPMDMQIVDTGYGLERLVWASNGAPTIYESIFPEVVSWLKEKAGLKDVDEDPRLAQALAETSRLSSIMDIDTGEKVIELRRKVHERLRENGSDLSFEELLAVWEPLEKVYALADHARCLAFMYGDQIVPSNVKAGYLARMVTRKALRVIEELELDVTLMDVVDRHLEQLAGDFPELRENRDYVNTVLTLETERYEETMQKGRRLVEREAKALKKGEAFTVDKLVSFYDAHGLNPEVVKSVAEPLGVTVDIPDDFYTQVAETHSKQKPGEAAYDKLQVDRRISELPGTKLIYYKDSTVKDFEAVVLWAKDDEVVLDQTAFYPEGGGQPADGGTLLSRDETLEVVDVQKYAGTRGPIVVHKVKGGRLRSGDVVHGRLDWGKRLAHTRHHTATHIILGAARRVLGGHVWQAGAQKGYDRARVDIQHYRRIADEDLRQLEQLVNTVVLEALPVEKTWVSRDDAERRYGMQLYQGGVPAGREVRVVRIPEFDVEACAGTHVRTTNEVGPVKLMRTERIQDGVERIEFSAGLAAVRQVQKKEGLLKEAAEALSVQPEELPKTAKRFFTQWKELRKENEEMKTRLAEMEARTFDADVTTTLDGATVEVALKQGLDPNVLRGLAKNYAEDRGTMVAVVNEKGQFVVAKPEAAEGSVVPVAKALAEGRAGGKPVLAQGVMPGAEGRSPDQLKRLVEERLGNAGGA